MNKTVQNIKKIKYAIFKQHRLSTICNTMTNENMRSL